jgi:hypothetical protein
VQTSSAGSSLAVAGKVFLEVVPVILVVPIAGVVSDHLRRKVMLVVADNARALLVLTALPTMVLRQISMAAGHLRR